MRVISQDGTMDFPYDNALVSVYKGCINGQRLCENADMWI